LPSAVRVYSTTARISSSLSDALNAGIPA
jgi:hypothetical protein